MIRLISAKKSAVLKLVLCILLVTLFLPRLSVAEPKGNEIVFSIILNGEKKGDVFAFIDGNKIFLPIDDLLSFGLKEIAGNKIKIKDKEYILLNSWKEVEFKLNEERAELEIIVPPQYLPEAMISLYPPKRENVIIPEQNSAFLNYRLDYTSIENSNDFYLNHALGIRLNDWSFITEGFYNEDSNKYTRLNSYAVYDNRKSLNRLVVGDFITPSGPLTSGNPMIGISYYKNFNIDPSYIYKPTFDINTFATFRSELEIYLDNTLIKKDIIPPGGVNLSDLYYYGGRKDIQIVIKDPYGRLETYRYPFYFTDVMLKQGVREFNYSVGFLRKNYSIDSNNYTNLGFLGFERYGYNKFLNIGGRFEGVPASNFYNLSCEAIFLLNKYGILSLLPSISKKDSLYGFAMISSYNYQFKNFTFRASGGASSDDYYNSYQIVNDQIKKSFSAGISYFVEQIGNFSIDFSHNKYQSSEKNILNLGYSKSIKGNASIYANLSRKYENINSTEFFLGLSIYPKKDYTLSARYENTEGRTAEVLQLSKASPIGEGYGYRINLEREKTNNTYNSINPYLQYRTKYGVSELDVSLKDSSEKTLEMYRLSYAGAVAYVSDTIGFTRPINDSFALIKTSDLENVKININGQYTGKTNKKGYLFVPDLNSYYDNILSLNDKDIPFEYDILNKEFAVSPWYKSGFCLEFPVYRVYRYTGKLIGIIDEEKMPLEYYDITIQKPKETKKGKSGCISFSTEDKENVIKIPTGKKGEFYIENIPPGKYKSSVFYKDKTIEFEILLPDKEGFIIDVGNIELILKEKIIKSAPEVKPIKIENTTKNEKKEKPVYTETKEEFFEKKEYKTEKRLFQDFYGRKKSIGKIFFKFNSTKLASKKYYSIIKEIATRVKDKELTFIELFGHCDQLGSKKYNKKLSEKRVKYVADEMIKLGVRKDQILTTVGLGKDYLVCEDLDESCRKKNRWVEIYIISEEEW